MGTNRPSEPPYANEATQASAPLTRKQKYALLVGILGSFYPGFAGSALNLAIPQMGADFGMGAAAVGWIITVYMLGVAATVVPFGKIADTTGRRRILLLGTSIFCLTSALAVFATKGWMILAVRSLQGIGSAMNMATCMPIAISALPASRRGQAIGIVTGGVYAGLALGPALGGFLTSAFSWRGIFVFTTVLSLVALFAAIRGVKKDTPEIGMDRFDLPGNLLFILSIGAVIYGLTAFNQNAAGKVVLAGGLVLLVVFVLQERKAKEPMMDLTLFTSDAAFTLSNLTALFNYAGTFAVGYMTSIYLQVVNGYSAQTAGILLITQPLFMTLLSPVMGRLSDRIAPYKLASLGMALCAAALLFFALLRPEVPIAGIVAALAVTGTGVAMFSPPNTNIIMSCVPPAKYGIANSILSTMRTVGHATGMAVITLVTSAIVGNISLYDADPAKLLSTIHIAFAIFCATSAAGIFMSLKRRNI